jgi:hypothetical protein
MGFFDNKLSFKAMKNVVSEAATTLAESVQNLDVNGAITSMKEAGTSISESTIKNTKIIYIAGKDATVSIYESVSAEVLSFDYEELRRAEYYQERYSHYSNLGSKKISEYFNATFEVDKSTIDMVEDIRKRLPVPAKTIDDIFDQCKREAMRRAVASFALSGVVQDIDNRSKDKYNNLSESYKDFKDRSANSMTDDPGFSAMKDTRKEARDRWTQLEDGYNKDQSLDPYSADIEHVVAKKELYDDMLLRAGNTDDEFYSLINSQENLVFADYSLNRSLGDENIFEYLDRRGRQDLTDPNLIHVDIPQQDGSIKTVTVNRESVNESYDRADAKRNEHRLVAAKEIGITALKTGAAMAAQQIVGLIVIETIDIFIDEIRNFAVNGQIFNENGLLQNTKDATTRIQQRLVERFDERQIWTRARALGIEVGVAGALSVIPQIIISLIIKMPSFILALIRECTLSTIRCVRVLSSKESDKLESIKIILAGTAAAIVGVYVGRVISKAIISVPLLNRFNAQVTDVLTGLLVTAVPLTAIYTFEQNKHKLSFVISQFTATSNKEV